MTLMPSQETPVAEVQSNRIKKYSLIAMWLCAVGALLCLIGICYDTFVFNAKMKSLPSEEFVSWVKDNLLVSSIIHIAAQIGSVCIAVAWLFWLVREKGNKYPVLTASIVICSILICLKPLDLIIPFVFRLDSQSYGVFLHALYSLNAVLSIAFGITLFFLKSQGKTEKLINAVGILYVINYVPIMISMVLSIAHIGNPITESVYYKVFDIVSYMIMLVVAIALFYNSHKQQAVNDKEKSGRLHIGIAYFIGLFWVVVLGLFIWLPSQTKYKLRGTWGYQGGTSATITFTKDNEYYFYNGLSLVGPKQTKGHYEIDGKEITLYGMDGNVQEIVLSENGCLYASDGSLYVKISDRDDQSDH